MRKIIIISIAFLTLIYILSGCSDSLGINGADYTKSQLNDEIIRRDTMIDFKKVIIETIITKTDTIIEYIPVNKTYDPIYSNGYNFQLIEQFINNNSQIKQERIPEKAKIEINGILDYNPLTPVASLQLNIDNSLSVEPNSFKERNEIIKSMKLVFNKLSVLHDNPVNYRELISNRQFSADILLAGRNGSTRRVTEQAIVGEVVITNRTIIEGQLRGLLIRGILFIPAREPIDLKEYEIEFAVYLQFPAI
ncbi:MAG: hypothetical protein KIT33_13515 [Candidatus Kapabacteria bacterium]|nr:hypothetical protein [Ignavibacteriota bacterium]MCW5885983.1 hypothetical protein [Candidatus Kapabacteria bacterium]